VASDRGAGASGMLPRMHVAERIARMSESSTLAAAARARDLAAKGKPVISLGAGEPDFATPENIREAAIAALRKGLTHYAPTAGTADARGAVAAKLARENSIAARPADVTITVGAKHAVYLAMQAMIEPGDEVVIPTPAWVSYRPLAELAGATVVEVETDPARGYAVTAAAIERAITRRTRVLVFNSPSNPTGGVCPPEMVREIAAMLARHPQVSVVSDEIYEKLLYPEVDPAARFLSIGACPEVAERTVTINGMSKAFAMTGWRIGYAAAPGAGSGLIQQMIKLQAQMTNGIPTFLMPAIVEALSERSTAGIEAMRRAFAARARIVAEAVASMPHVSAPPPSGAFYSFLQLGKVLGAVTPGGRTLRTPSDAAEALLEEALVAAVPGEDFGGAGRSAIRLSFACGESDLREALARIRRFLDSLVVRG